MKKVIAWAIVMGVVMASAIMLPGCSTSRGLVGLVGGIGKDVSQGSNYLLQHTQEDNYDQGYRGHANPRGGQR